MLVSMGILAACLPTLKPLLAIVLPGVFKSTLASQSKQYMAYGSRKESVYGPGSAWRKSARVSRPPPPLIFKSGNASMFDKEMDGDGAALKTGGSGYTSAGTEMELSAYHVSSLQEAT